MRSRLQEVVAAGRLLAGGRSRAAGGIVLGYHDIVTGDGRTAYDVPVGAFAQHLRLLDRWGLRWIALHDLIDRLQTGRSVDGFVAVTFDDALAGVHRHAWPILDEAGIPFTVFAVTDELGRRPSWWPEAGEVMSRAQLTEMAAGGVNIECHTRHHPSLPALDARRLRDETAGAKNQLEDIIGAPSKLLAYPFGHHDSAVRSAATAAGFHAGFSFLNGRVTADQDHYKLPRFTMDPRHRRVRLALHVARPPESWPPTQHDVVVGHN